MKKTAKKYNLILEALEERPFITYATKKTGVSRSTIYRWMAEDFSFDQEVNKALHNGRSGLADIGESKLVQLASEGNLEAIKFLLRHNSDRYNPNTPGRENDLSYDHFGPNR